MIDLRLLREKQEYVISKINSKNPSFPIKDMILLYQKSFSVNQKLELLLAEQNSLVDSIKKNINDDALKIKARELKENIEQLKEECKLKEKKFFDLYLLCPNIVDDIVPLGNKNENRVVDQKGKKPSFDFIPLPYYELHNQKNMIVPQLGADIAKSGFLLYQGDALFIIYRLAMLFLKINSKRGFIPIKPPLLINEKALTAASNLPVFKEDLFAIQDSDLYLIPTAEVSLSYMHHDSLITIEQDQTDYVMRYTAWTSCFRKEAGGYGSQEKGMMRMHEFEKVEIFSFTTEENSLQEHKYLLETVETILIDLGLHYNVVLLAAQDCSFASACTYDIEIYLPGHGIYKEVSSISNCRDYQARRSNTRYRYAQNKKSSYFHTLNGSSLAIPRLLIALMETYQRSSGECDFNAIHMLIDKVEKNILHKERYINCNKNLT